MPTFPTPLASTVRYMPAGIRKVYFLPTIADAGLAATRTEMTAGTDLSPQVAAISGFNVTSNFLDAPDLGGGFISKVAGRTSSDDSSITFYSSKTTTDVRTVLQRNTAGYILVLPGGDVPAQKMNVFPVTVGSESDENDIEAVAQITVTFAITNQPAQNVAIPANP